MPADPTGLTPPAWAFSTPEEACESLHAQSLEHARIAEKLYRLKIRLADVEDVYYRTRGEVTAAAVELTRTRETLDAYVKSNDMMRDAAREREWVRAEVARGNAALDRIRMDRQALLALVGWRASCAASSS